MAEPRITHLQSNSAWNELRRNLGCHWPSIERAAKDAQSTRERIWKTLNSTDRKPFNDDLSLVVFGSLARDEWTSKSDVDWTLLVDGQADPEHLTIAQWISGEFETAEFGKPSPAGVFGNLAFSHDIIHQIGGQHDTNQNTTQRILLLLEATALGGNDDAFDRVVRGVLERYLEDDPGRLSPDGETQKLPRFLLNDLVRFWRTIAVDFASKQRERGGKGWGLRNAKLRLSRKLIFASGLLMCFSCIENPPTQPATGASNAATNIEHWINHLSEFIHTTPLEIMAAAWIKYPNAKSAAQMFTAYDEFLSILNDEELRKELENLRSDAARDSKLFGRVRDFGHKFQESLNGLFFETEPLFRLTKKYGVF